MIEGKWEDWAEPLKVLLATVDEFLEQIDFRNYPRGGVIVKPPGLYLRKGELGEAFDAYVANVFVGGFLDFYIYASSIFADMYALVFEYMSENEHQMDLHGDEMPQTETELIQDFGGFVFSWESPIVEATEMHPNGTSKRVIVADGVTKGVVDKDFKDKAEKMREELIAILNELRRKGTYRYQYEVADALGISHIHLSYMKHGHRSVNPDKLAELKKL